MTVLLQTPLPNASHQGKVRDLYDLGDRLLIVATDRISAFDVVLPNGVPGKGAVLTTELSLAGRYLVFASFVSDARL